MKNLFLLLFIVFAISCTKEEGTSPNTKPEESTPVELRSSFSCDDIIEGEPTYISGYYTYPEELLNLVTNKRYTLTYDAMTLSNQFQVIDATGSIVAGTNGYVSGNGQFNFDVCSSSALPFKLLVKGYSPTKSLDLWKVTFSCLDIGCGTTNPCCEKLSLSVVKTYDSLTQCCTFKINFVNNSTCKIPVYQNGVQIAIVNPNSSHLVNHTLCVGKPYVKFDFGKFSKTACKTYTAQCEIAKNIE